ncbi:unnamed protein product [Prorocentrum cordatum]|uniref:Prolyl 4-hydroxylase alpha subunit domain-containing protein n=1 Tax=Prorocentrum cordatum TaxID=2364126 RepID=A0ABN9PYZ1_9DINO|nr:unnamed protein product [Polarella glacialis]
MAAGRTPSVLLRCLRRVHTRSALVPSSVLLGAGAAAGGAALAEWRELNAPRELAAERTLPDSRAGSLLAAVRLPMLLDEGEIEEVLELGREVKAAGGATEYRLGSSAHSVVRSADAGSDPASASSSSPWHTTFLHTGHLFQQRLPALSLKLRQAVLSTDGLNWGICRKAAASLSGSNVAGEPLDEVRMRTIELHEVGPGGALPQRDHVDSGSCVTLDVMLCRPGVDFEGGALELPPAIDVAKPGVFPEFLQGDALVFPSHKFHCVHPVSSGLRRVLVIEFWCGEDRSCPHRCHQHYGTCKAAGGGSRWQDQVHRLCMASAVEDPVKPW